MKLHIQDLLFELTSFLADYLNQTLQQLDTNWWDNCVLDKLSYGQKNQVIKNNITSLSQLDLAALLRILDSNWYKLSESLNLKNTDRHYLKEMITIRNQWAHISTEGIINEDIYRDLDTLKRFSKVINANSTFIEKINSAKKDIISESYGNNLSSENEPDQSTLDDFKIGDVISLKSDPTTKGAILSIESIADENLYNVFMYNKLMKFYESQLKKVNNDQSDVYFSKHEFDAFLTATQIKNPSISHLYSLNSARIDFIPYQFRPVLKFIKSDRPRLLIADSVGVGKTIEAGLILRELQARTEINSVLIICPRALVVEKKWENEMKRFDEQFIPLDSKSLNYCISEQEAEGLWPRQYNKTIMSYSLFNEELLFGRKDKRKTKKGLLDLDPPVKFDLVIVDEAHYTRNSSTMRHQIVKYFCDNSESVIFLTATPIQMGNNDLFTLLNILRPDLIIDKKTFEAMSEPNVFVNQAIEIIRQAKGNWQTKVLELLDAMRHTSWGKLVLSNSPQVIGLKKKLEKTVIDDYERVRLISEFEETHTFSSLINRTRRRDIGDFTIRKPKTIETEFTKSQRSFYDKLMKIQIDIYELVHENINLKFLMTNIRRRATSCLFGLIPFLKDILTRSIGEFYDDEYLLSPIDESTLEIIKEDIELLIKESKFIDKFDPKVEELKIIIREKQSMDNNKIILFSSFRHTLSYLEKELSNEGFRYGLIHGGVEDYERVDLKNRFELNSEDDNAIDILLFSDVGAEGLDYQFCDCMINYDLPWNPMKIEQRIGRIDRNGQKSESIAIYNMITPDTIDAAIYERCLLRIGIFNSSIGHNEEILGEITSEIKNIAEDFNLSKKDLNNKLKQLSDNKIRSIVEYEKLEKKQFDLFGIRFPKDKINKDIEDASSYWLQQRSIKNLIELYLSKKFDSTQEYILGEKEQMTLRLSLEHRSAILEDMQNSKMNISNNNKEWYDWLKGNNPHLPITFDSDYAMKHREISFIMPLHPLVKIAANEITNETNRVITTVTINDDTIAEGVYSFMVFSWHYIGIRNDLKLVNISQNQIVSDKLDQILIKANSLKSEFKIDSFDWEKIKENHYIKWKAERIVHKKNTIRQIEYKQASLKTSFDARLLLLKDQLNAATNDKIKRMKSSQIQTAELDFARRYQELDLATERTDINTKLIVYGILKVVGNK